MNCGPNSLASFTRADEDAVWLFRRRCAFAWWLLKGVPDGICDVGNHVISSPEGYLVGGTLICNACAERWRGKPTGPDDVNPGELPKARESAKFAPCIDTARFDQAFNGEESTECLNAVKAFWRHYALVALLFEFPLDMICANCKKEHPAESGYLNVRWPPPLPEYKFYCSQCIDHVLNPESFYILQHMEASELEFLKEFAELRS